MVDTNTSIDWLIGKNYKLIDEFYIKKLRKLHSILIIKGKSQSKILKRVLCLNISPKIR